jgi:NMT1/THI5 like
LVTNVLQGGDIVQVATTIPYAIQSLIVKADIKTPADLAGKKMALAAWERFPTTRCKPS